MTTHEISAGRPEFDGERSFIWFTPQRRRPTEYELYTVGQQSGPEQWLDVDWPLRFDDGRAPWDDSSSAVRTTLWFDYRDPNRTWQRPYVSVTNQDGQALARLLPVLTGGSSAGISQIWSDEILSKTYGAWPFVEYGLFLALAYTVREARADTIEFATVFQAADRMRLLQDIVLHLDHLSEDRPGFSDSGARTAWMTDPTLTPIREIVEHLVASKDWVEILVVTSLVFEPLIGYLAKVELFSRTAVGAGDAATATVFAQAVATAERAAVSASELVKLVLSDPATGGANAEIIAGWLARWKPMCERAARAFLGGFGRARVDSIKVEAAYGRAVANCEAVLSAAGLKA